MLHPCIQIFSKRHTCHLRNTAMHLANDINRSDRKGLNMFYETQPHRHVSKYKRTAIVKAAPLFHPAKGVVDQMREKRIAQRLRHLPPLRQIRRCTAVPVARDHVAPTC